MSDVFDEIRTRCAEVTHLARFVQIDETGLARFADALASEALHIMEERKITSLPVVDADRKLQGVIQIHDLWRTELF